MKLFYLKLFTTALALILATAVAEAQTAPADSLAADSIALGEVTVTAAPVIRKADRDVYVPNAQIKERSTNGMDLLQNLQIPSIFVDNVQDKVNAGGDDVQFRINGREASLREVKALTPESVVRVEYLDNPGLRYKGATNVINFVVRNPTLGGSLMANVMSSLNSENISNAFLAAKLNSGKSQWGANMFMNNLANFSCMSRSEQTYLLPTQTVHRTTTPETGKMGNTWTYGSLYYNFLVPDRTNIYFQAQSGFNPRNKQTSDGTISETVTSRAAEQILYSNREISHATYPSLNFYIDQKLGRKQTLVLNVETGWRKSRNENLHSELPSGALPEALQQFNTHTRVNNFDIKSELNYIKEWSKTQLTAGANYYQAWWRTHYYIPFETLLKQRQQNIYFFTEATHNLGAVSLTAGLGGEHLHQVSADGTRENKFAWRPRFSGSWRINGSHRLSLTFNAQSSQPDLSQLSSVWTQSDPYRASTGNPFLKSSITYTSRLSYMYTHPRLQLQANAEWRHNPALIEDYYYLDADKNTIVQSYDNISFTGYRFQLSPRVTVIKNWLTLGGSLQLYRFLSHGAYGRTRSWSLAGNYSAEVTHWNWTLSFNGYFSPEHHPGQTYYRGECIQMIMLSYKHRNLTFTGGVFNPYGNHVFSNGSKTQNYRSHNVMSIANNPLPLLQVSYNLNWGKQKRQGQRLIDGPSQPSGGGFGN